MDVFDTDGRLLTPNHLVANAPGAGPLENPWAIVRAPANFGAFSHDLLIGNVEGAGNINAFNPVTGAYLGQLKQPDGTPIAIPGLWDLEFKNNQLFFAAGATTEDLTGNGLFGRIDAASGWGPWDLGHDPVASTDGAGVISAPSTIAGLAPLPPASAIVPEATAYGWLIDIMPTSSGVFTTITHQGKSHKTNGDVGFGADNG